MGEAANAVVFVFAALPKEVAVASLSAS